MSGNTSSENTPFFLRQNRQQGSDYARRRDQARRFLNSKQKHYMIMGLVALDVAGILTDIFVALISCDKHEQDEDWVSDIRDPLQLTGLVISCLFLAELGASVWAFGLR